MDYTPTHKQLEDRALLRDQLADATNTANAVRTQPSLTKAQRESLQWAQVAMLKARREFDRANPAGIAYDNSDAFDDRFLQSCIEIYDRAYEASSRFSLQNFRHEISALMDAAQALRFVLDDARKVAILADLETQESEICGGPAR